MIISKLYNRAVASATDMHRLGKYLSIPLVVILLVSVMSLFANTIDAQTTPKPAAPEFTVKWTNSSYHVPATSTIDPYYGTIVDTPSQLRINYSITVIINNQPTTETLRYNIRTKGNFESNWSSPVYSYENAPTMSNQATTCITFTSASNEGDYRTSGDWRPLYAPVNGQIDFQVQAFVGYYTSNDDPSTPLGYSKYFTTIQGDWSNTQTLTIDEASVSTNSTPIPSPTIPEFPSITVLSLFVLMPIITIFVKKRLQI